MANNNSEAAEKTGNMTTPTKDKDPGLKIEESTDTWAGPFNMKELNDHLGKCIRKDDKEVDMDEYIKTFQQLYK